MHMQVQVDPTVNHTKHELNFLREENAKLQRRNEELLYINNQWASDYQKQETLSQQLLNENQGVIRELKREIEVLRSTESERSIQCEKASEL